MTRARFALALLLHLISIPITFVHDFLAREADNLWHGDGSLWGAIQYAWFGFRHRLHYLPLYIKFILRGSLYSDE